MSNINRDYLVILDVKSGGVTAPNMYFFNTDKKTNNIYVQLIVKETIVLATPIENATDFSITMNVIKPGQIVKQMEGVLVNESEAIYEFDLPADFTNLGGAYQLEFMVNCLVSGNEERITSSPITYTVNESILTGLNADIVDDENYPILLSLIDEVKKLQEGGGVDTNALASKDYVNQQIAAIELTPGPKGDKGDKGDKGEQGEQGPQGEKGDTGPKGDKGDPFTYADFTVEQLAGLKGAKGDKGDPGERGPQGLKGNKGDKGDKGDAGANGKDGLTTQVSVNGTTYTHTNGLITLPNYPTVPTKTSQLTNDTSFATETFVTSKIAEASLSGGEVDLSGYVTKGIGNASQIMFSDGETFQAKLEAGTLKGEKGDKGDTGEQGPQGERGIQGEQGPQGEKGEKGEKGNTGAQGPAGANGTDGTDGQTPNITIGTVTTLDPGANATAEITGTTPNLILNLGIPKGADGSSGTGDIVDPVVPVTYEWEIGGITSTGSLRDVTNRIRTADYITFTKKTTFQSNNPNYVLRWYKYDTSQMFVEESGVWETKVEFEASTDYVYRVAIRNSSDANITTDVVSYFDIYTGTKGSTDTGSIVSFYNDYPALFVPYKFKLEAHRGYSDKYPENTLLAFEEAGKISTYSGIETDVHRTSDGVFVLMHDSTIDRTTNGTGKPSAYTYAELQEFYIDGGNGWSSGYANQLKIPKLTEYLEICRKYNKIPYIQVDQVDSSYLGELIKLLDKEGWKGRCVLTSFTFADLAAVRAITDEYIFEYMISVSTADSAYTNALSALTGYKNVVFRPDAVSFLGKSNAQDFIYKFREAGILVECYGLPVGDTATLNKMIDLGIEGCTCNSYVGFEGILGGATSSASVGVAKDLTIEDTAGNFTATNVEDALAELFQFVSNGKSLIASAITDMGITTSNTDTFQTMANNIKAITGSPGVTTYTITNNLTNCSTSNDASSINANSAYSATIAPDEGHSLNTISVSMGDIDITNTYVSNSITYEWQIGGLSSSGNFNNTAKNRIRTIDYVTITDTTTFTGTNNYQVWWYKYNASDLTFVEGLGSWVSSCTLEPSNNYVYMIAIRKSDNSNITVDVSSNVTITTANSNISIPSVTGNLVITATAN